MNNTEVVFGIPGSGKTTYLLRRIDELAAAGYPARDIAYLTMTRNARSVARKRMAEKYGASKGDLQYFRTMHSICWELIGRPGKVSEKDIAKFCKARNVEYAPKGRQDGETYDLLSNDVKTVGDLYFTVYDRMRLVGKVCMSDLNKQAFTHVWFKLCQGLGTEPHMLHAMHNTETAYAFLSEWENHKRLNGVVDFPDMLYLAYKQGENIPTRVLVVDEFQDLCPLMYEIYRVWKEGKEQVVIAGDDDQAIYSFMGASPRFLLMEKDAATAVTLLDKSYRCPEKVMQFAGNAIARNTERYAKTMRAVHAGGSVEELYLTTTTINRHIRPGVATLILARTNSQVKHISEDLIAHNVPFRYIDYPGIWSDKFIHIVNAVVKLTGGQALEDLTNEEFAALVEHLPSKMYLRKGAKKELKTVGAAGMDKRGAVGLGFFNLANKVEFAAAMKITDPQKLVLSKWGYDNVASVPVRIGTIHKAKGDEARDVFLYTYLPDKVFKSLAKKKTAEEERRVRYVGVTRASERTIFIRKNHPNDLKDF
jgi:DNA helicase-2/ATP-dependent DNA helicase PcrA